MATTGQQIFEMAMALLGEIADNGEISASDTASYKAKTPTILTILETELAFREGLDTPDIITDLDQPLTISDRTARLVMAYGLTAELLLEENPEVASYYNQKYEEMKKKIPGQFRAIVDVYGVGGGT